MAEGADLLRRWFHEVWNERREQTIDELMTAESICDADGGIIIGPEAFKAEQFRPFLEAFPDLSVEVVEVVESGELVVGRWRATATHLGALGAIQPTGLSVEMSGTTWVEIRDGRFQRGWQHTNLPQVFARLGAATA